MDTAGARTTTRGRRFLRSVRGWACAFALVSSMAPGPALADTVLVSAEDETPAPMPFQLPAASASAEVEASGLPSFSLLLMLLSGVLVAGTLSAIFLSLAQREHAHPAPSRRW
jgi:hypothetical protein